jgi:hypothetical protein
MKKVAPTLCFTLLVSFGFGQATSVSVVKKQIQGTWLGRGDSISELLVTQDSITTFRFKANGVSRCSYALSSSSCDKVIKFPAATGVYIVEKYKVKTLCCSLAEIKPDTLKIIYPDGNEVLYLNESTFLKKGNQ